MSEPQARAATVSEILPGVLHWTLHDDRLDFRSDAYAVHTPAGLVLIDPLPLEEHVLRELGTVAAICIGGPFHQRSAWRYRAECGARVWAPRGSAPLDEPPDAEFDEDDRLPGGLTARIVCGPTRPHAVFVLARPEGTVLFVGDLVMRAGREPFAFVPDSHQDDPAATRRSVRGLLELRPFAICPAHGNPQVGAGAEALDDALARDAG